MRKRAALMMATAVTLCVSSIRIEAQSNIQDVHASASTQAVQDIAGTRTVWKIDKIVLYIGLPGIKANTQGSLAVSSTKVMFIASSVGSTKPTVGLISYSRILSISSGEERIETGGKAGKIARVAANKAVPHSAGSLLGLVTQGQVDLLTIEYEDEIDAYHGAVFILPKGAAQNVISHLPPVPPKGTRPALPNVTCNSPFLHNHSVKISPIASSDSHIPKEYLVALYEQLYSQLRTYKGFDQVYRDGDTTRAASCSDYEVRLTVNTFRKGNAVLRTSAGMVGNVLGKTKIQYTLLVTNHLGRAVFRRNMKAKSTGDSESMDVSAKVAKSVLKVMKKQAGGTIT